jgi:hypothetical protein
MVGQKIGWDINAQPLQKDQSIVLNVTKLKSWKIFINAVNAMGLLVDAKSVKKPPRRAVKSTSHPSNR